MIISDDRLGKGVYSNYITSVVSVYEAIIEFEISRIPRGVRHPPYVKRARRLIKKIKDLSSSRQDVEEIIYLFTKLNLHMFSHGVVRLGILPFLGRNNKK